MTTAPDHTYWSGAVHLRWVWDSEPTVASLATHANSASAGLHSSPLSAPEALLAHNESPVGLNTALRRPTDTRKAAARRAPRFYDVI